MGNRVVCMLLGLVGGVLGGVIGYYVFFWIARQGFYGMIIPGAMLGLGCGLLARQRSLVRGVVCGLAALLLGFYTQWKFMVPLDDDPRFIYLLTHFYKLGQLTLLMIGVGAFLGFWLGKDAGFLGAGTTEKPSRPDRDSADVE